MRMVGRRPCISVDWLVSSSTHSFIRSHSSIHAFIQSSLTLPVPPSLPLYVVMLLDTISLYRDCHVMSSPTTCTLSSTTAHVPPRHRFPLFDRRGRWFARLSLPSELPPSLPLARPSSIHTLVQDTHAHTLTRSHAQGADVQGATPVHSSTPSNIPTTVRAVAFYLSICLSLASRPSTDSKKEGFPLVPSSVATPV